MPKVAVRDRRALKFYTERIWGFPTRSIPLASCGRPKLPICEEYQYTHIEYSHTRLEWLPAEPPGLGETHDEHEGARVPRANAWK